MKHVFVWDLGIGDVFVEPFVLVDCHFTLLTVPDRTEVVNDLAVQLDWMRNELRELFYGFVNETVSREFTGLGQKFQNNTGASCEVEIISIRNLIRAATVGNPSNALVVVLLRVDLDVI